MFRLITILRFPLAASAAFEIIRGFQPTDDYLAITIMQEVNGRLILHTHLQTAVK
jgi:hypothetical protein